MPSSIEPKSIMTKQNKDYLDYLREEGITNMMGAAPYLERKFSISKADARQILTEWFRSV